jgi:hypothetical protein
MSLLKGGKMLAFFLFVKGEKKLQSLYALSQHHHKHGTGALKETKHTQKKLFSWNEIH